MRALLTRALAAVWLATRLQAADTNPALPLKVQFDREVRPLLRQFCFDCHSTEKQKGDLDLERFTTADLAGSAKVWDKVVEQLGLGEMPPKQKPQPTGVERDRLVSWINAFLEETAQSRAGDPGPVVLRRLNNAEYRYTVHDLTQVESLDPGREFPADGAAGEGFMNTGQALVMSPALLNKYFEAGQEIASHAVLLPEGFRFSAKTTRRDWTEEILGEIRTLYRQYTDAQGAEKVNLQGIIFETNEGGRLPLEAYLRATLELRDDARAHALARPAREQIEACASGRGLSPKYLAALYSVLQDGPPSFVLARIRALWGKARLEDAPALAAEIARWQRVLWKFGSVGHIGKVGGPKAWMEPVNPLLNRQEFRIKLAAATNAPTPVLYLTARSVSEEGGTNLVIWQRPRLVLPGRPELLLREACARQLASVKGATEGASQSMDAGPFGRGPDGSTVDADSLCVRAPSVMEIRLLSELVSGAEFVAGGELVESSSGEACVQLQVTTARPDDKAGLLAGDAVETKRSGPWTSDNRQLVFTSPFLVKEASAAQRRVEDGFDEFRRWFPAALCYEKIVPVDEVVTLTLFHREDEPLCRLMLDHGQKARLDRLWDELHFVSRDALTMVDVFEQLWQYATQDADPKVFEPLRQPIQARAASFRTQLVQAQSKHVDALLAFAARAYRRPLSAGEREELGGLYRKLRAEDIPHEEAFQLTLAKVFVSPAFLYRLEVAPAGAGPRAVSDWELATRLSYFLWSSAPDAPLAALAAAGELHRPDVLARQTRRLLSDGRVRRLATEFGSAWLHLYDFEQLDEKSERHFPTFASVRGPLYEEAIRYLTDLFQHDGSVLDLFDSDYTFLNEPLARHYGIISVKGEEWRRVDGVRTLGRGGVLGLGAVLAKESGASRTSPILRGNWVAEVLLGDKLPRPPKDVPRLPEDEAGQELTVRQLVEKHSTDPRCAVCHVRIDGYGFALEGYDAIGRFRTQDLAHRPIDARARLFDGTIAEGALGLRQYLVNTKREAVLNQFARKLLGYALGREVILADKPLLAEIQRQLRLHDYRVGAAVLAIVGSPQFQQIRGRDYASAE